MNKEGKMLKTTYSLKLMNHLDLRAIVLNEELYVTGSKY